MIWILLMVAWLVGSDAVKKLSHPHPTPAGWFEAAITLVLVVGGVVRLIVRGDDD